MYRSIKFFSRLHLLIDRYDLLVLHTNVSLYIGSVISAVAYYIPLLYSKKNNSVTTSDKDILLPALSAETG